MFYDTKLMQSNTLGVVWCYANKQKVATDNVGVPKICSTIKKWVDHDGTYRSRMSLRTSTLLLNGTARLYKDELDKLYKDCVRLDSEMLYRRSRNSSVTEDNNPDCIMEEEVSLNSRSKNNSRKSFTDRENSRNSSDRSLTRSRSLGRSFDNIEMSFMNSDQSPSISKVDAEVQTNKSYIANKREKERYGGSDSNSPGGVILLYDEQSRIPNKIIWTNINKNIELL